MISSNRTWNGKGALVVLAVVGVLLAGAFGGSTLAASPDQQATFSRAAQQSPAQGRVWPDETPAETTEVASGDTSGQPQLLAAEGYLGSEACGECHFDIYNEFRQSGHPYKLTPASIARNRPIPLPKGYTWDDISYVIGGYKWKSRYMDNEGYIITSLKDGTPGMTQWNYMTHRWVDYHAGEVKSYNCGTCHTTGYSPEGNQDGLPGIVGTWAFPGVQCEACHGAGGHFQPIDRSAAACGQCHIRGESNTIPASGGFIKHHEQYNEHLASPHADLNCVDCHDPHQPADNSIRATCESCHENVAASYASTEMAARGVECIDCHMPFATKSADVTGPNRGDIHTHLIKINTSANGQLFTEDGSFVALGGTGKAGVTLDFACLECHFDQDMKWAAFYSKNFHSGGDSGPIPDLPKLPKFPKGIFP